MSAKKYFVEQACAAGHTVYDFQHSPIITDLNNYRDTTHYGGHINDYMTLCFAGDEYICSPADCDANHQKLLENIAFFEAKYSEHLA